MDDGPDYHQQEQAEAERWDMAKQTMREAREKGVSADSLAFMAFEFGLTRALEIVRNAGQEELPL